MASKLLCDVCGRPLDWNEKKESWGGLSKPVPIPSSPPGAAQGLDFSGLAIGALIGLILLFAFLGWVWRLL
jgi:hypothetical protein